MLERSVFSFIDLSKTQTLNSLLLGCLKSLCQKQLSRSKGSVFKVFIWKV